MISIYNSKLQGGNEKFSVPLPKIIFIRSKVFQHLLVKLNSFFHIRTIKKKSLQNQANSLISQEQNLYLYCCMSIIIWSHGTK